MLCFFKIIKTRIWGEKNEIWCLSFSYCYGCDLRTTKDLALLASDQACIFLVYTVKPNDVSYHSFNNDPVTYLKG